MRATRPWTLAAVAAACALVVWLIVRVTFTVLPPLPWTAVPALLILAIAEGFSGRNLRARIQGRRGGKPLAPIAVARMAALAKASSLGGAVFGGFGAGFLAYTLGSIDKAVPRSDAINAGATLVSAAVLVAAALYLEHSCRAPTPPDDEDPGGRPKPPGIR
jgi:4-amino-4-deoxy-L-arabinose transferase-like glycosyltransferase